MRNGINAELLWLAPFGLKPQSLFTVVSHFSKKDSRSSLQIGYGLRHFSTSAVNMIISTTLMGCITGEFALSPSSWYSVNTYGYVGGQRHSCSSYLKFCHGIVFAGAQAESRCAIFQESILPSDWIIIWNFFFNKTVYFSDKPVRLTIYH